MEFKNVRLGGTLSVTTSAAVAPPTSVTSVTINNKPTSLSTSGGTHQLSWTVLPETASDKSVSFESTNTGVATVSPSGLITPVGSGSAIITVTTTDGSHTDNTGLFSVTVSVTGVSINNKPTSMTTSDGPYQLNWAVSPANATDSSVSFESSNTGVATVSPSGIITPVGEGSVDITITTNDGSFTDNTGSVSVTVSVTGVSINNKPTSMTTSDGPYQLNWAVSPANATDSSVSFESSNTGVATVSGSGLITPISEGSSNITITTTDGGFTDNTGGISVTVSVTGVSINNKPTSMTTSDGPYQLNWAVSPANASDKSVSFESSNTGVATVSGSGLITPISEGSSNITITTTDGGFTDNTGGISVTVLVTGVSIDNKPTSMTTSDSPYQLNYTVSPGNASDKSVSFESSNTGVATVSGSGLITPIDAGSFTVTVTTNDGGFTDNTGGISVTVLVTGVSIDNKPTSMTTSDSPYQLNYTVSPGNASDKSVSFESSNTGVATVSGSGLITPIDAGSFTVTVTTNDGGFTDNTGSVIISTPFTPFFDDFESGLDPQWSINHPGGGQMAIVNAPAGWSGNNSNVLDIDGYWSVTTTRSNAIELSTGQTYRLSVDMYGDDSPLSGGTVSIQVGGNTVLGDTTISVGQVINVSEDFTVSSSRTYGITFTTADIDLMIDNVSITEV